MKGSYNAVTQSASGEYTGTDYREQRKNTVMGGGMILFIILVLAGIAYFFFESFRSAVQDAANQVGTGLANLNPIKPGGGCNLPIIGSALCTTTLAPNTTYMGVTVKQGTQTYDNMLSLANKGYPIDDPLHNVGSDGSIANQNMAIKLTAMLNNHSAYSPDDYAWAKQFEPALYNLMGGDVAAKTGGSMLQNLVAPQNPSGGSQNLSTNTGAPAMSSVNMAALQGLLDQGVDYDVALYKVTH